MKIGNILIRKSDIFLAVPYLLPFLFLALWIDWAGPGNMQWAEVLLVVVPGCALAWWHGWTDRKLTFGIGMFLEFYVNFMCLHFAQQQLEAVGELGFLTHFESSTPMEVFVKWFMALVLTQMVVYLAAYQKKKREMERQKAREKAKK